MRATALAAYVGYHTDTGWRLALLLDGPRFALAHCRQGRLAKLTREAGERSVFGDIVAGST
jgi:hypothetical protein